MERKKKGTEGTGMVSEQLLSIYYMPGPVLGAEDTQVSTRAVICLWQVSEEEAGLKPYPGKRQGASRTCIWEPDLGGRGGSRGSDP